LPGPRRSAPLLRGLRGPRRGAVRVRRCRSRGEQRRRDDAPTGERDRHRNRGRAARVPDVDDPQRKGRAGRSVRKQDRCARGSRPRELTSNEKETVVKSDRWDRLAPLTGIVFVALIVIAFAAIGRSTPGTHATAEKVQSFYSKNH